MEIFSDLWQVLTHLGEPRIYFANFVEKYKILTYFVLFAIIFCETGLIVTPLLPGDSLLFAAGFVCSITGVINPIFLIILLIIAALLGDNVNYFVGRYLAKKGTDKKLFGIFTIKKEYLKKTEDFYAKHGGKTIILARFVPIVRTFAPFVAGLGAMLYRKYIQYCILGAILWVTLLTSAGYFLGNLPFVQKNFEKVVLGIVFISLLPVVFSFVKSKMDKK